MPFSEKSLDFLFENHARDSKEWFNEHKDIYRNEVIKPFTEIIEYLAPIMDKIDSKIVCTPRKISRIYRDARFSKGKSIFRESLWISLCRPKSQRFVSVPEFYFYVSPQGFGWGCGYYRTPSDSMEAIRRLIIEGDKTAKDALKAFDGLEDYFLLGEKYKRDHYPEQDERTGEWLNRKSICVSRDSCDAQLLFSDKLAEVLAEEFCRLEPIYRLYIKAEGSKNAAE